MFLRRSTPVSASRNKRPISIATRCVVLATENRTIVNAICHHNMSGWTLIGLNSSNEPVRIWSSVSGYQPFRCTVLPAEKFRDTVIRLKPSVLYVNNMAILTPIDPSIRIVPYTSTLTQILDRLSKDSERARQHQPKKHESVPTFDAIRQLDQSITYRDYMHIYGKQC